MNILLLEDSGSIYAAFNELATENGINFIKAYQISDAIDVFDTNKDSLDIILVDLNVIATGLTNDEINLTDGGKLSGWIWLKNYVLKEDSKLAKKVIIYSEYINVLKKSLTSSKSRAELNDIAIMEKGKFEIEDVIARIKEMVK